MSYRASIPIILLAGVFLACRDLPVEREHAQQTTKAPTPTRNEDLTLEVGLQYWAPPFPLLCKDWYVVVGGTVLEKHEAPGNTAHENPFIEGTLLVEHVFLRLPTRNQSAPSNMKYFKSAGFDDLEVGEKVIIFVNEYDGGYGIIPTLGSNCRLGIKVNSWEEPIVEAIEAITKHGELVDRKRDEVLKNPRYIEVWRPYSKLIVNFRPDGISCFE
jgi:hypothetical protein